MKNRLFVIISLLLFSCNSNRNNLAEIEINKVRNFGTIKVGDTIKREFYLKNLSLNN